MKNKAMLFLSSRGRIWTAVELWIASDPNIKIILNPAFPVWFKMYSMRIIEDTKIFHLQRYEWSSVAESQVQWYLGEAHQNTALVIRAAVRMFRLLSAPDSGWGELSFLPLQAESRLHFC